MGLSVGSEGCRNPDAQASQAGQQSQKRARSHHRGRAFPRLHAVLQRHPGAMDYNAPGERLSGSRRLLAGSRGGGHAARHLTILAMHLVMHAARLVHLVVHLLHVAAHAHTHAHGARG